MRNLLCSPDKVFQSVFSFLCEKGSESLASYHNFEQE